MIGGRYRGTMEREYGLELSEGDGGAVQIKQLAQPPAF